jgi:hypothetical protein
MDMGVGPDARPAPGVEAPPAGAPRWAVQAAARQGLSADAFAEDVENAAQAGAVVSRGPSSLGGVRRWLRQIGLEGLPQFVGQVGG